MWRMMKTWKPRGIDLVQKLIATQQVKLFHTSNGKDAFCKDSFLNKESYKNLDIFEWLNKDGSLFVLGHGLM